MSLLQFWNLSVSEVFKFFFIKKNDVPNLKFIDNSDYQHIMESSRLLRTIFMRSWSITWELLKKVIILITNPNWQVIRMYFGYFPEPIQTFPESFYVFFLNSIYRVTSVAKYIYSRTKSTAECVISRILFPT